MNKQLLEQATKIAQAQHGFFGDGNEQVLHIYTQLPVSLLRRELIDQYGHRALTADEDTLISMLDSCEITPAIESIIEELNSL